MESALTITPPRRTAISSAIADLPLAVGPAIRIAFPINAFLSMAFIATLISRPGQLMPALGTMAAEAAGASAIDWLAEQTACEFALPEGADPAIAEIRLREALAASPVDVVVQPAAGRRKKMLIADMDSTMIDQ